MTVFVEHPDRYESQWRIEPHDVTISVDKPISPEALNDIVNMLKDSASLLLERSVTFFESKKAERRVEYIDDLSDPQILVDSRSVSVYWWSDKGNAHAEPVIGVEFTKEGIPFDVTIGD